jgi:hypothetical protein
LGEEKSWPQDREAGVDCGTTSATRSAHCPNVSEGSRQIERFNLKPKTANRARATSARGINHDRQRIATVIGVGPGLGAALARRFAADYAVALVARNAEKLLELAREISAAAEPRSSSQLT